MFSQLKTMNRLHKSFKVKLIKKNGEWKSTIVNRNAIKKRLKVNLIGNMTGPLNWS